MQRVINEIARELLLPPDVIKNTYKAFWQYIKDSISSLPLDKDLTEGELNELRVNFNIPNLGKLVCPYHRYEAKKRRRKDYVEHKED